MQWFKAILYNASIFSLFCEFKKKYPHPVIIYENTTNSELRADTEIYEVLTELNSQWISKSLEHNVKHTNEIKSLHVFCVDSISDTMDLITENILRYSNSFKIQNLILLNVHEPNAVPTDIFAKHERLHRNTLICELDKKNITCWHWVNRDDQRMQTFEGLLYEPVNLNLLEIQVEAHNAVPNAFSPCLLGRFIFTGLDAMVTAEIVSKLNATPRYCNEGIVGQIKSGNCNKKDTIEVEDALKLMRQLKVTQKIRYDHVFYHTVFDSRMIKHLFFKGAECYNGPMDLKMNTVAVDSNDFSMIALLPTEFSCISILVPKASAASSFIRRTIYNSVESIGFISAVLLFTIGRIVISKSGFKQWFSILYSTFAVFLSQNALKPKSIAERLLYGTMLLTSVFTTVMLSGLIFTNLVNNPSSKPIQTLNDLAASQYNILTMKNIGNWTDHLREDIREKLVVVDYTVITSKFLTMDTSSAFAIEDNMLVLFRKVGTSSFDYKFNDVFYEIGEKLHCGYFAYRISNDFPLEDDINQIIQRMVDHGFITAFRNWSLHILKLSTLFTFSLSDENSPFSLEHIFGIFCLYLVGIGISFIVFSCEKIVKLF